MNKINTFTSTGSKLIHHPEKIAELKAIGIASPLSLQIAPTSKCNLNCCFCSNVNREKHEELDIKEVIYVLRVLKEKGLKAVETTGGGDPTMYSEINSLLFTANSMDLKTSLITNGVALKDAIRPDVLETLTWIRVSLNSLDYVKDITLPDIEKPVLGFSYVMNEKTTGDTFRRIDEYIERYNPSYVRIVPNCQATDEEQEENNRKYSEFIEKKGAPYFYQAKTFNKPERCWWGYFKPFLLHDGYVYPCSSVVLNEDAERSFHKKYRWVHMSEIHNLYENKVVPFDTCNCTHCVFTAQNNMVDSIINPNGMEDFV